MIPKNRMAAYERVIKKMLLGNPMNCGTYEIKMGLHKSPKVVRNMFTADTDKDGIKNIFDCHPLNRKLHGVEPNRLQNMKLKQRKIYVTNLDVDSDEDTGTYQFRNPFVRGKKVYYTNPYDAVRKNPKAKFAHITDKKNAPALARKQVLSVKKKLPTLLSDRKKTNARIVFTSGSVGDIEKGRSGIKLPLGGWKATSVYNLREIKRGLNNNEMTPDEEKFARELLKDEDIKHRFKQKKYRRSSEGQRQKHLGLEPRANIAVHISTAWRNRRRPVYTQTYDTAQHEIHHAENEARYTPGRMKRRDAGDYPDTIEERQTVEEGHKRTIRVVKDMGDGRYAYLAYNNSKEKIRSKDLPKFLDESVREEDRGKIHPDVSEGMKRIDKEESQ